VSVAANSDAAEPVHVAAFDRFPTPVACSPIWPARPRSVPASARMPEGSPTTSGRSGSDDIEKADSLGGPRPKPVWVDRLDGNAADVRFEEKQWMPLWVGAIFVLVPMAIASPLIYQHPDSGVAWILPPACGLFLAIVFWVSTARRWIRVDDRSLRIGDRKPIPLRELAGARIVEGRELRRARQAMIQGRGLSPAAAGLEA